MAYTSLPTFITGDLFTAANANTYWRDNFEAGAPGIFAAAGDLVYATAADTGAALTLGSAGEYLTVNAGATAPEWRNIFSGCHVSMTTDQTIATQEYTKVVFDTEVYDTDSYWSTDNTDAVTIPIDGVYQCSGTVSWDTVPSTSSNEIQVAVRVGSTIVNTMMTLKGYTYTQSWCYITRFAASADANLQVWFIGMPEDLDITAADYQVTYLGAST